MMKSSFCLYVFLLLLTCATAQNMKLMFVENAAARGAVCNDGSPAAYYFYPGSNTDTWVIHQEGGWWCWDNASCLARAHNSPQLTSSTTYPQTMGVGGIFSTLASDNPSFYNANFVYIKYCTSDAWSGSHVGTGDFTDVQKGWHFKGKYVVKAVIQDLTAMGMNSTDSQILLTGCSAGGNGVFVNVDYVRSILPFTPARYLGFSDAGWISNYDITYTPFLLQYLDGFYLWEGIVNEMCTFANQDNPYLCYFGAIVQPYIVTPVITHIEQYDIVQFQIDCACTYNNSNPAMINQMKLLRASIAASVYTVRPPHAVFSPACTHHCSSLDISFNDITVGGVNLQQFLTKFWDNNGSTDDVIDNCTGLNCSGGCSS